MFQTNKTTAKCNICLKTEEWLCLNIDFVKHVKVRTCVIGNVRSAGARPQPAAGVKPYSVTHSDLEQSNNQFTSW